MTAAPRLAEPRAGGEIDIDTLRGWIGRSERRRELIAPERVAMVAATLDRPEAPAAGEPLPALWHWASFTETAPLAALGTDGHPKLGGFMPPIPLPRRMWVGGRLRFVGPLRVGDLATRVSEISDIKVKSGGSGTLVFVTLRHEIGTEAGPAIIEEQDLVYRASAAPGQPGRAADAPPEAEPADWSDARIPGPALLFRYSAVTFNAHRIHYDAAYARDEEGYPGLVVQGPLTATLLAESLAGRVAGRLAEFSFRAAQPLFADQPMTVRGRTAGPGCYDLWAETPGGQPAMTARARLAP